MKYLNGHSDPVGLCASCRFARTIKSDRGSIFYQCARAATDPRYPRYPRLPMIACPGYELREECREPTPGSSDPAPAD